MKAADGLTVGELARRAGVNVQTIRYYEREGLLPKPPRTAGGYRAFPAESVARVRFIKRAQELGFTLDDAKELLDLRDHPGTACPEVLRRAEAKLRNVADRIRHLRAMHRELDRLAKACAGGTRPHACPLLEALEQNGDQRHEQRDGQSARANRPLESDGGGAGRGRGVDLLRRPAGAAGARRRRRVGRQSEGA